MKTKKFMQKLDEWLLRITRVTIIVALSYIVIRAVIELAVMIW